MGGAKVAPPPDAIVTLELQNGPDAVRVVWPDGAIEVVGYGALEFAEYSCGAPAPWTWPPGQSLARVPDAADLGSNALDFRAATPSPGRANQPRATWRCSPARSRSRPSSPSAGGGGPSRAACVENRGATASAAGEATLGATARRGRGGRRRCWRARSPPRSRPATPPPSTSR